MQKWRIVVYFEFWVDIYAVAATSDNDKMKSWVCFVHHTMHTVQYAIQSKYLKKQIEGLQKLVHDIYKPYCIPPMLPQGLTAPLLSTAFDAGKHVNWASQYQLCVSLLDTFPNLCTIQPTAKYETQTVAQICNNLVWNIIAMLNSMANVMLFP